MLATKFIHMASLEAWRSRQVENVCAVNGCFDIIHAGHVRMLQFAAEHGRVIVGLNSDESVKRLKGPSRPINTQSNRAAVIAALSCVDAVTIFEDTLATEFLSRCKPHFWIKGGDYTADSINQDERLAVEGNMGRIRFFSIVGGLSTTNTLARMDS